MALKVCVIGCGQHACAVHGPSYQRYQQEYSNVIFCACCDVSHDAAAHFATKFGFACHYTDYQLMLAEQQPDAVIVLVPAVASFEIVRNVMLAGCAVMMEKPIGNSLQECNDLIALAEKTGVINQVAFNRRHIPLLQTMMNRIAQSNQKIQHIGCEMYRYQRSGLFHHAMIHAIDAVKYIAQSDYQTASFSYQNLPHCTPKTDNIYMDACFENNVFAHITTLPSTGVAVERFTVALDEDCYFLRTHAPMPSCYDAPGELIILHQGVEVEHLQDSGDSMYLCSGFYAQTVDFLTNVITQTPSAHPFSTGLQSMQLAEFVQARQSSYYNINTSTN